MRPGCDVYASMAEPDNIDDSLEAARRVGDAMRLFSQTFVRVFELLGMISAMPQTIAKTMPFGQAALEMENTETVLAILADRKLSEIFKDPAAMAGGQYREFARNITEKSMTSAKNLASTAALVFAHGVFDATLFDYCRVSALWAPNDWTGLVGNRKISITEVEHTTKYRLFIDSIDNYLKGLERESILKKADVLHQVIKPQGFPMTVRDYQYEREKLESIDEARHQVVHQLRFRDGFPSVTHTIDYLRKTAVYFMGLIHRRYGLKLDPNVDADGTSSANAG
jgi:hypothetical protein